MKIHHMAKFLLAIMLIGHSMTIASANEATTHSQASAEVTQASSSEAQSSQAPSQEGGASEAEAVAQDEGLAANLSDEELGDLIGLLNNSARIEELKNNLLLIQKAKTEPEASSEVEVVPTQITEGLLSQLKEAVFKAKESFEYLFDSKISFIPTKQVMDDAGRVTEKPQTLALLTYLLSFSGYILLSWALLRKLGSYLHVHLLDKGWALSIPFLIRCVFRMIILALPIIITYFSTQYLLKYFLYNDLTMLVIVQTFMQPFLVVLFIEAIASLALSPDHAAYRLVNFRNSIASWLLYKTRQLLVIFFFFLTAYEIADILYKSGLHVLHASVYIAGFIYIIAFYSFILSMRRVVSIYYSINRKHNNMVWFYDLVVDFWHIPALAYAVIVGLFWFLDAADQKTWIVSNTIGMLIAFVCMLVIINLINYLARKIETVVNDKARLNRKHRKQAASLISVSRYAAFFLKLATIVIYIGVMLHILGVPLLEWVSTGQGENILHIGISLSVIIIAWFLVREVFNALMQQYLNATNEEGEFINHNSRLRTVLPLLKNIALIVLALILFLLALTSIGVSVTPVLAFSGVLSLAIALGSQKLVGDFITGMFYLIEDTMQVGDVIEINGRSGTIEELSIRSLRLRDLTGSVHTIPFGSIEQVCNLTKGFSYALMEIGVAYRENVDEVMEVLAKIGEEMYNDTPWRYYITEDLEVLGVDSFGDNAVNIRCRFRTRADKKWTVRREFNRRVKNRFDELNIEIPFPHVTLYFGEDKNGDAPAMRFQPKRKSKTSQDGISDEPMQNNPIIDTDVIGED